MDWDLYLRGVLALAFVVVLIGLVAWLIRRFGINGAAPLRRRARRLAVLEVLPLDGRRRLVLVRRDDAEHLLLMGGGGDLVIENIGPSGHGENIGPSGHGESLGPADHRDDVK